MLVRLSSFAERLRSSLFYVPMLFVVLAIALAGASLVVDAAVVDSTTDLPLGMASTVDSAREVLSTIAGATITFAGIAFSISLLVIQQTSSQYSPRVVHGLFRDPFNKRMMGIVVGTFTYCLLVLRSVRSAVEQGGEPVIPNVSVAIAVVLGVVSILSIIAFISHSAHAMDVSKILENASKDARQQAARLWRDADEDEDDELSEHAAVAGAGLQVDIETSGWIQQIDHELLAHAADPGGVVRAEIGVGRYAVPGTPLCSITPSPHDREAAIRRARRAVVTGDSRTAQQDVSYGVRRLADVAIKALSPGVNDPTTAQDALFHIGGVLRELLVRRPPPVRRAMSESRVLELTDEITHADLVALAFDQIRLAARGLPSVCIDLLEVIHLVEISLHDHDAPGGIQALRRQADLVLEAVDDADLPSHDRARIREAHAERFTSG